MNAQDHQWRVWEPKVRQAVGIAVADGSHGEAAVAEIAKVIVDALTAQHRAAQIERAELLAALEACLHYIETPGDFNDEERAAVEFDAAAAIARAKGEGTGPCPSCGAITRLGGADGHYCGNRRP